MKSKLISIQINWPQPALIEIFVIRTLHSQTESRDCDTRTFGHVKTSGNISEHGGRISVRVGASTETDSVFARRLCLSQGRSWQRNVHCFAWWVKLDAIFVIPTLNYIQLNGWTEQESCRSCRTVGATCWLRCEPDRTLARYQCWTWEQLEIDEPLPFDRSAIPICSVWANRSALKIDCNIDSLFRRPLWIDLISLDFDWQDMWDVLKDYPAARVRLESIACKRMEKYKKEPLKKRTSNYEFGEYLHYIKTRLKPLFDFETVKSRNAVIGEPVDTDPIVSTSAHSTLRRRMAHPMQTAHPSPASLGAGYDMDSRGSSLLSHPLPNRTASATVQADHQTHSVHHHQSHHHYHLQPPQHSSHHFRDNSMSAMLPVSGMRTSGKVKPSCMSPNESVLVIDHRLGITPNTLSLPDAVSGRNSSGTPLLQTFDTNPSQPLLSASMPSNLPIPGSKLASTYGKDYYESASRQAISSLPTSNTRSPMPREYGPMLTVSSIPVPTSGSSMHLSLSPMPTLSPLPQQALLISATPDTHLVTHSSAAPDVLFDQIRQLNQRLQTLEAENALLSNRLAEQRMTVHNRLSVLQQQLDRPTSSGGCPPADEQPLVASVHGNESIANVMSHSPRMSFKRNETKSRSQHSNAHAFSTDARSEMIAGERAPSPATVQLFNDPDLEDQELISILSEDSERNKESTIWVPFGSKCLEKLYKSIWWPQMIDSWLMHYWLKKNKLRK